MVDTLTVVSQYIERIRRLGTLCSRNDITVLVKLILSVETTAVVRRIVPVFVTSSASTTYRAVVVTTQLSLATLGFVSSILWPLMCCHSILHDLLLSIAGHSRMHAHEYKLTHRLTAKKLPVPSV